MILRTIYSAEFKNLGHITKGFAIKLVLLFWDQLLQILTRFNEIKQVRTFSFLSIFNFLFRIFHIQY